jgi:serine/threonine protein kinase
MRGEKERSSATRLFPRLACHLRYTNNVGTAENWTAKLIDFSHSVIRVKESSLKPKRNQMLGTDLYRPPELAKPGASFNGDIAERVDI